MLSFSLVVVHFVSFHYVQFVSLLLWLFFSSSFSFFHFDFLCHSHSQKPFFVSFSYSFDVASPLIFIHVQKYQIKQIRCTHSVVAQVVFRLNWKHCKHTPATHTHTHTRMDGWTNRRFGRFEYVYIFPPLHRYKVTAPVILISSALFNSVSLWCRTLLLHLRCIYLSPVFLNSVAFFLNLFGNQETLIHH